ncbi:alpha/beta fold hydrolase [Streptomyces triticagri]|uniref:Alpha/beta fold hydrolase n=1 Tax=Streptomyces triticagri TaxID=2293568 RepID=A0A372M445_9ACTN|nr:alpha/beta fold hydrolase [Streptomyces triticagri]RFU85718.1 alpha/beta fold hydrolase [Streptomyces triticagri]
MIQKDTAFYSEGSRLEATVYYPDDLADSARRPALVVNSGYQGFNEFYPRMFAERMTERGFVCLGFDYRGMADSEGEKGRVLIEEQAQDIRNAVTFLAAQDGADPERIGLIGWGMGAANVILAAEKAGGEVAAVASLNGFYDGRRWLKSIHTYDEFQKIVAEVAEDRRRRVLDGASRLADTFEHYPLDPATGDYVEKELSQVHGFGHPTRLQFTESILDLKVQDVVAHLSAPLFIGHGERNSLHPYDESLALYAAAPSPKTLYTIDGRHNDFMYGDHPEFVLLCDRLREFFDEAFAAAAPVRSVSA